MPNEDMHVVKTSSSQRASQKGVSFFEGLQDGEEIDLQASDSLGSRRAGRTSSEIRKGKARISSVSTGSRGSRVGSLRERLEQARRSSCSSDPLGYKKLPTYEDIESMSSGSDSDAGYQVPSLTKCISLTECSLQTLVESGTFQVVTMTAIIANAAVIGFETDFPEMQCWVAVELGFLFIFTVELVLRVITQGPAKFFCGRQNKASDEEEEEGEQRNCQKRGSIRATLAAKAHEFEETEISGASSRRKAMSHDAEVLLTLAWNFFDFIIVSVGLINSAAEFLGLANLSAGVVTIFRAIRLLRVLRVLRVIRVLRFFKQLYLLAYGFIEGTMAVFWVAVLASCCIYLFSILLVKSYGHPDEQDPHQEFFIVHFGSVSRTMFTLFEILASPSLGTYRDVIFDHPPLVIFLLFFVIFGSFGISGLLTGVITESIIDKNQARIEERRHERETKRCALEEQSGLLFDEMAEEKEALGEDDHHEDGIEYYEPYLNFIDILEHKEDISHLFQASGVALPMYDFNAMCEAMDSNDSGNVTRAEFIHGILELCEDVRPMSIMELHSQMSKVKIKIERIQSDVEDVKSAVGPRSSRSTRSTRSTRYSSDSSADEQYSEKLRDSLAKRSDDPSKDAETRRQSEHDELKQMIMALTREVELLVHDNAARHALDACARDEETRLATTPGAAAMDVLKDGAVGQVHIGIGDVSSGNIADQKRQSVGSAFTPGAASAAAAADSPTAMRRLPSGSKSQLPISANLASALALHKPPTSAGVALGREVFSAPRTPFWEGVHPRIRSY